jgi:hypothetical protein
VSEQSTARRDASGARPAGAARASDARAEPRDGPFAAEQIAERVAERVYEMLREDLRVARERRGR